MKTLSPMAVAAAVLLMAAQATAALPNQPAVVPAEGDHGVYATQFQTAGPGDADLAKAYDNFTLDADIDITGFRWAGIYAEPFPASPSDTDFIVQIWNVDAANSNYADTSAPVLTFNFEGGAVAGMGGADLVVTALGHTSPATDTTPGGGEAYHYDATVLAPVSLAAGDYWISILANQLFDNADPIVDPEWQWHLGNGPGDGFTAYDRYNDPVGTLEAGILQPGKDLAFEIVPEPNSALMAMFGLATIGFFRRKRS